MNSLTLTYKGIRSSLLSNVFKGNNQSFKDKLRPVSKQEKTRLLNLIKTIKANG